MTTLVVIEDEALVRDALERLLVQVGYDVATAATALEGLAVLATRPVQIVLVDIVLPGMNGVEAIKRMRRDYSDLRIVAMSGGGTFGRESYQPESIATQSYLAAALTAGADAVLAKPFESRELLSALHRLVPAPDSLAGRQFAV